VLDLMRSTNSSVIKVAPFAPLMIMKYVIALIATPPHKEPKYLRVFLKSKVKTSRVTYCTNAPIPKAITTDSRMPEIIRRALAELIKSLICLVSPVVETILRIEIPTAAPSNSKTIETVVDVGNPKVLKRSSRITSVIITARKINMISSK